MAAKTEQFKSAGSNIGRTIGQSWSMITGKDVANYSLLFLDETLTRKRGEHETIFMPHIVLGRSSRCHVRYGDAFRTVSREHASITVDGNSFVLNHNPSASNPTYVNGRTIGGSHFLQNGDEIQLSSNGPKIRFNASTLKTSTIGLTSRIGQAMSQAVKPYQKALYVLGFLLIAALGFAGYNMYQNAQLNKELVELTKAGEDVDREIAELIAAGKENSAEMDRLRAEKQRIVYRTNTIVEKVGPKSVGKNNENFQEFEPEQKEISSPKTTQSSQNGCPIDKELVASLLPKDDVVVILGKRIEISFNGKTDEIGETEFYQFQTATPLENRDGITIGTGFLTENGDLLTCRHVIEPWIYYKTASFNQEFWRQLNVIAANGGIIKMSFQVLSSDGSRHDFDTEEVNANRANDIIDDKNSKKKVKITLLGKKSALKISSLPDKTKENSERFSDWARVKLNITGQTKIDQRKSEKLNQGRDLFVLGYSQGLSLSDKARRIEPMFSYTTVSNSELFNKQIFTSGGNFGPGNSGGPAYICEDGEYYCVGIVSHLVGTSNTIVVPIGNVRGAK